MDWLTDSSTNIHCTVLYRRLESSHQSQSQSSPILPSSTPNPEDTTSSLVTAHIKYRRLCAFILSISFRTDGCLAPIADTFDLVVCAPRPTQHLQSPRPYPFEFTRRLTSDKPHAAPSHIDCKSLEHRYALFTSQSVTAKRRSHPPPKSRHSLRYRSTCRCVEEQKLCSASWCSCESQAGYKVHQGGARD